jgi:predicted transcriptional regulator of viral defense system
MITAAQASAAGIARSTILRREQGGTLERVRHGVYRLPGAPADPSDVIRSAWLVTAAPVVARDRLDDPDVVVGGAAAASLHGIGDLPPAPVLLFSATRRRSRHDDVRYSTRPLSPEDVMVLDGLPVTTRERTIADLLDEPGSDLSTVADALRDAELSGADVDEAVLIDRLGSVAKRIGHRDGAALYEHLRALSRVDEVRLRNLLEHTDIAAQVSAAIEDRLREALRAATAGLDRQVQREPERVPTSAVPSTAPSSAALPPITLPPSTLALIDRITAMASESGSSSLDADQTAAHGWHAQQ